MLSVFVASISNLISVGGSTAITSSRQTEDVDPNTDSRIHNVTLGKAPDHLIWFIQVCTVTKEFVLTVVEDKQFLLLLTD
jgi:hypothetical protein